MCEVRVLGQRQVDLLDLELPCPVIADDQEALGGANEGAAEVPRVALTPEAQLKVVLAWCSDPDAPNYLPVSLALEQVQDAGQAVAALAALPSRCPRTAERARRMLRALSTDGFAAFG